MGTSRVVEVVVVGAGPGGSATAAHLARADREVVLLEAQAFPRPKVCGDVLLPEVDDMLQGIGTSLEAIAADALLIGGCRYVGATGRVADGRFEDAGGRVRPSRILPRKVFDARLAAHAVRCGAQLAERHKLVELAWDAAARRNRLTIATPRGLTTLVTPLVIGADGAASRVARDRGLRSPGAGPERGLCIGLRGYVDWRRDDRRLTVVGDRDLLPGCGWIVPQAGGLANVGVGMIETDRRARGIRLKHRFQRFLADHVPLAGAVRALQGWQLPASSARRLAADGVLLVGDAAGLIDPFTGHGIQNAIRSGVIAAAIAERAIRGGDASLGGAIATYERSLRSALGTELGLGSLLQRFHARARLVDLALARAAVSPRWADRLMGLVGHAGPKRELLRPAFLLDFLRPRGV